MNIRPAVHAAPLCLLAAPSLAADPCPDWQILATPVPPETSDYAPLGDVEVLAPDDVWAVGTFQMEIDSPWSPVRMPYALHWDGTEWNQMPVPSPQACPECDGPSLGAIEAVAPDDIWAAGNEQYTPPGGFFGVHTFVIRWDGTS